VINLFVGYDPNETKAFNVYSQSIQDHASVPVSITPVRRSQLEWIFKRPKSALESTEFSISRFLVPFMSNYEGWSIFVDCDFLCLADIHELYKLRDDRYAVQVCQHNYIPQEETKFLDAVQTKYSRKNWSSLIMFNNARCRALTPEAVENFEGLWLHQFRWLKDREIGELPLEWNWLVGVYPPKKDVKQVHYTLGGPYFSEYEDCDYSREWWEAYRRANYVTQKTDIRSAG
jgi:hypothetical protein